ncbi:MAG: YdcF family protein [Hyphomicrobiaceae bacterium]|nr:YdcF family protein [Hyphomicrobiaceae bacterium]
MTRTRHVRLARKILSATIIILLVMGFSPLGNWLLIPLEQRFSASPHNDKMPAPYGIIVLGGSINTIVTRANKTVAINEAGERLFELAILARRYPKAKLVFSGGSGRILSKTMSESKAAQKLFTRLGIAPDRILYEDKSKNTWQNAQYTKTLIKSSHRQRWLLVTSAFHMARSVGCFRKNGINIIPWPVDFRTRGHQDKYRFFDRASQGWKRVDVGVREWIGLLVYRLSGRTDSLFPS